VEQTENLADRLARLCPSEENSEARVALLQRAHDAGASDKVILALATAIRIATRDTIKLPAHRFESLSRGRGWARKGRGDSAEWGERVDGGYRVGPGKWTVGGHDGFSRKGQDTWTVAHVTVGSETWTVAS
jgi:hypothetical protein